jgi:mannose-6-phosphate isomerase-like protein (cupin superfamily)
MDSSFYPTVHPISLGLRAERRMSPNCWQQASKPEERSACFAKTIAAKSGPPAHIHRAEDEFFYVVSGEFSFKLGARIVSAPARSIVFAPRGTARTFQNVGTEPGVLLVGVTPGGFEKMFAERQDVDAETNRTLMKMHNMEVVGPPLQ